MRLYQNVDFVVKELSGTALEQCRGLLLSSAPEDQPSMLYVKALDQPWYKLFLDAGLGFCKVVLGLDSIQDHLDEDDRLLDYAAQFGLTGRQLEQVYCQDGTLLFRFQDGALLQLCPKEGFDEGAQLAFAQQR